MAEIDEGSVIGNYRVIRLLGQGGMGTVYEVEHLELGTRYALKTFTFDPDSDASHALRKKFLEEGKLLARLRHPNLTHVFDLGFEEKTQMPYFVMDLVVYSDGETYTVEDIELGDITEEMVYRWFKQLASALDYIHGEGIVHRDIKPSNLLVDKDLNVVLTDFGISRIFGQKIKSEVEATRTVVTKTGRGKLVLGTEHYIAPEVAAGEEATPKADAYSLGVMLLRWLTGFYYGDNPGAVALLAHKKYSWLSVIPRLLAPAGRRPESYTELVKQVKPAATPAPKPAKRRNSRTTEVVAGAAAALLAVAVLGACGYGVWRYIEKKNAEHDRQVAALAQQIRDREEADRKAKAEAEAARKAKEAEEKRIAEAKKEAEAKRLAEEKARKELEEKRIAEAKRMAEEKARKEAEEKRLAEENRKAEEAAKAAEADKTENPAVADAKPDEKATPRALIPTEDEIKAVMPKIEELTKDDLAQLWQRKMTKEQYADALAGYAGDEKNPAAKFVLLKEAFRASLDAKSWEKADNVYAAAQAEGGTEYALAAVGTSTIPSAAKELKEEIEAHRRSYRQIGIMKGKLKKVPDDKQLCESLGLEYASVGDWNGALAAFKSASGEVAKVADWELSKGDAYTAAKAASFWWGYADGKPKAKMEALCLRAAMWYELALGENAYSGNELKIVQGRIEETKSFGGAAMQEKATITKREKELRPIVLPLKGKTVVEFVGVPAGEFTMGPEDWEKYSVPSLVKRHKVTITRPFWLSKYQVTKDVWATYQKVALTDYDKAVGGMRVPQCVSYAEAMVFCEWLTKRIKNKLPNGYIVRVPSEAEWEYALFVKDHGENSPYRKWERNVPQISCTTIDIRRSCVGSGVDSNFRDWELDPGEVGTKMPNGLGLYDMLGNGCEVTLDTFDDSSFGDPCNLMSQENAKQTGITYSDHETDPLRYCDSTKVVVRWMTRGTGWHSINPHPYHKTGVVLRERAPHSHPTIRLCIGPDLMKEKGYKFKLQKK